MMRPMLVYGAQAWTATIREEGLLERTETRMLHWILGVSLKDKKRNEVIRKMLGVACITDKIQEVRLRWYDYVMRRNIMVEVNGRYSRRWQKERHDTTRHAVSPIEERSGEERSEWLTPPQREINSSWKEIGDSRGTFFHQINEDWFDWFDINLQTYTGHHGGQFDKSRRGRKRRVIH